MYETTRFTRDYSVCSAKYIEIDGAHMVACFYEDKLMWVGEPDDALGKFLTLIKQGAFSPNNNEDMRYLRELMAAIQEGRARRTAPLLWTAEVA